MSAFHLQVITLDGVSFDGDVEKLIVRTTEGEVCILAKHIDYVAPLGMGEAKVVTDSDIRSAACIGGLLIVSCGEVKLAPTTFEWAEDIDIKRAEAAQKAAEEIIEKKDQISPVALSAAEAKLRRALVRQSVAKAVK